MGAREGVRREAGRDGGRRDRRGVRGAGIEAKYDPDGAYGFYLETITSPYDGRVLGWDEATGRYWQLFVNGEASSVERLERQFARGRYGYVVLRCRWRVASFRGRHDQSGCRAS
ncbi:MAG: hypothetical protein ACLT98_01080 [Eggerthellaceae bacterium]